MFNERSTQTKDLTAMNVTKQEKPMLSTEIEKRYKKLAREKQPRSGAVWQRVKEKNVSRENRFPNKSSAYWNHVQSQVGLGEEKEYRENVEANPDLITNGPKIDIQSQIRNEEHTAEVVERVRALMSLAKQILTEQQYNVFILTMVKDPALTYREAGKTLGISFGRVRQLADATREKLQKAYTERT